MAIIPYGRQSISDEDVGAVVEQLRSDWLTQGPAVARFEKSLTDFLGVKYAVAVSSGTAALHLACLAGEVGPGSVAVTTPITFVASANCVLYAGGRVELTDVDAPTALMSVDALAARCAALAEAGTPPKAIIPVDFSGQPADLAAIRQIADRYHALVIEDAAHSLGATYRDGETVRRAADGHHADMACLSFHPVKHITTGEGGAVTTNDGVLYQRLLELRTHGITRDPARLGRNDGPWYYEQQTLGFNYRITDIQCALGSSQMTRLDTFLSRRREIAQAYDKAFAPFSKALRPLTRIAGRESAHHLYIVRVNGDDDTVVAKKRRALYDHLRANQIAPQVHYVPVHHQPFHAKSAHAGLVNADAYYAGCLSIPMFPAMTDREVDTVVRSVTSWVEGNS